MSTLSWIITILGFVATIVGSVLAFFTYISPMVRLKWYLKNPEKWKKIYLDRHRYNWQYKNHPEFNIEIDTNSDEWTTVEKWMPHCPDIRKSVSIVKVKINGQTILTESFLSMDGGRYFVPVAKRKIIDDSEDEYLYYYTKLQIELAKIVSDFYREKTIEEFIKQNNLTIFKD